MSSMSNIYLSFFPTGGQRQRLAIARAIYSKAPCTFLDNPFSALDPDLANHVFNVGILKILKKRKRTVLLATDRTDFFEKADRIVFLRNGRIEAQVLCNIFESGSMI
jgi:ABC-type thiamine transport system ATPase subunit